LIAQDFEDKHFGMQRFEKVIVRGGDDERDGGGALAGRAIDPPSHATGDGLGGKSIKRGGELVGDDEATMWVRCR